MKATDPIDADRAARPSAPAEQSDNNHSTWHLPFRVGQRVEAMHPQQGASEPGVIVSMTEHGAFVKADEAQYGTFAALWHDIMLHCNSATDPVQAQPAMTSGNDEKAATPSAAGTWYLPVRVGMRAQGWDGDSTDGGEIVAITPELCHIKGEAAGCVFTCPWSQVTFHAESLEQPIRLINGNGASPVNTPAPTDTPEPDYTTPYSSMPTTVNTKDGETDVWPGIIVCEQGEATGYLVIWTEEAAILRLPDGTVHQQSWCVLETTGGPSPLKIDRFRLLMCQLFSFEKEVYQLCKKYSVDPEKYDELGSGLHQAQRDLGLISDEITEQAHRDKWLLPETVCGCRMGGVDDETVEGGVA